MNLKILTQKIEEKGIKKTFLAKQLNLSRTSFSLKIAGTIEFKWSEIEKMVSILDLTEKEKKEIFFTN